MTRLAMTIFVVVFAAAALGDPGRPASTLVYSGDDIAAGPGTMTIRCNRGRRGLWELDLVRDKSGRSIMIRRFDDLTDKGDFSYAPPEGNRYDLFVAHRTMHRDSFRELHKGDDFYEYKVHEGGWQREIVTRYRIVASDAKGMRIVATRTLVNTAARRHRPLPTNMMDARLSLAVGPYDGRRKGGNCKLMKPDSQGWRRHQTSDGKVALYAVRENCMPSDNKAFDRAKPMWCEVRVEKSAASKALGLVAGRTFRLDTDLIGYYPASNVGRIDLTRSATNTDALNCSITPREWHGEQRTDHTKVGLDVGEAVTKTFTLKVNIAAK
jgi:hypothetical protein